MNPSAHIALSAVTSVAFYSTTKSWEGTLACFLAGVLIDLDHVVDYCLSEKKFPRSYKEFFDYCIYERSGKLYLIFHSYELLAVVCALAFLFRVNIVFQGALLGIIIHMVADQLTNPLKPLAYFLTYRLKLKFDKDEIMRPKLQ